MGFSKHCQISSIRTWFEIDGAERASCALPRTYKYFLDWEGFSVGRSEWTAVTPAIADKGAFPFNGNFRWVKITLGNDLAGPNDYETGD